MTFAIFKGEKNIKELVSRLFHLPDKGAQATKDKAVDALLQANPHLKNINKVPVGSVIHVPPGAPPLHPAEQAPPSVSRIAAMAQQAQSALDSLNRQLTQIDARTAHATNALLTSVQSKEARHLADRSTDIKEELPALVDSVKAMVKGSNASQAARQKSLAGLRTSLQSFTRTADHKTTT